MKYLVTGAAGFIGSHLTNRLILDGHDVTAVDNFSDYYSPDLKHLRVSDFLEPNGIRVINANLEDEKSVRDIFHANKFDSIFHLAAQPGVRIPLSEHGRYISSNLTAFSNLLIISREFEVANFLYASSSSVYGNCKDELFSETDSIATPVSFYGGSKLANEVLAKSGGHDSKTRTRGMRFFTVYGPWGRPDMAYFRLIASIFDGYKFSLFGNGSVLRDFTFVDDVVNSVIQLNQNLNQFNPGFSDVVNVGGGNPLSVSQLVSTLEEILSKKVHVNMEASNINDVSRTCADPRYLKSLIGTEPHTKLEIGLESFVNWAKQDEINQNLKRWSESVR